MNSIKKSFLWSLVFSLIFSLIFSVGGVFLLTGGLEGLSSDDSTALSDKPLITDQNISTPEDEYVTRLVEEKKEAVVSIVISKEVQQFRKSNILDQFLLPFGFGNQQPSPQEQIPADDKPVKQKVGGGSGFIIRDDGLIVTNKHVVEDPNADYTVITLDGTEYEAEVKALDPFFDVAIIQIKEPKEKFSVLTLGDSDQVKVGQTILAIGNALAEFAGTVTKGIISGLNRNTYASDGRGSSEKLSNVFQVDAAINPGNSGGPLINLDGEVIGINTAVANAENLGFVLPVNDIKQSVDSYLSTGKILRPKLGVRYLIINEEIQKKNNLEYGYGALVLKGEQASDLAIIPGGPADKAGIEENDIILEIDGVKIDEAHSLVDIIQKRKIGDTVKLKVWHDGKEKEVETKLEDFESKK